MQKKHLLSKKMIAIFASLLLLLNMVVPIGLVEANSVDAQLNDQVEKNEDVDQGIKEDEEALTNEQVNENEENDEDINIKDNPKTTKQERGPPKKVTVRVEGHDKTIVEPTEVEVSSFDLKEYINNNNNGHSVNLESPRAIHAIIQALEEKTNLNLKNDNVLGLGSGGNYIEKIAEMGEFTHGPLSGWKYFINNSYVSVGVLDRKIEDGEEIVLFYTTNFTDNTYTWFENESYTTEVNEDLHLKLNSDSSNPVENATLLIDDIAQGDIVSDEEGKFTVNFDKAGTYNISAMRSNNNDEINIVRPYTKVKVEEKEVPEVEKNQLETLIEKARNLNTENKTETSVVTLEEAVEYAKEMIENESATPQEVDSTVQKLNDAIEGLTDIPQEVPEVEKNQLETLIEKARNLNTENKTETSVVTLEEAVEYAKEMIENESATQQEVDATVQKLNDAIEGLTDIPEEKPEEEKPDTKTEQELKEKLNKSVDRAIGYAENHFPDYTEGNPGSHSDYWAFSAFWAAGLKDIETEFNWKGGIKPSADHTFWEQKISKANRTSNEDAGTIIGSIILGQSPYDFGTQNVVADLEDKQKDNGSFFHIHGEPWAMIALELVDSKIYEKEKHIDYILGLQDKEGMFGDADSTGWMLMALAPYTNTHSNVKEALDKSINHIHKTYKSSGTLPGMKWGENSNAITSMHMGLAANGENLLSEKWTNDMNIVDKFIDEYQFENGSFAWEAGSEIGALNMSTEQVILSLATIKEQESIFTQLKEDMNRIKKDHLEELIKEAKELDTTNITDESIKALEDAIQESEAVLSDDSATQKEVNEIEEALNDIIEALEEKSNEATITIQSITNVDSINVPYGTKENEIDFPDKIELNLDNDTSIDVKVEWSLTEKNQFNPNEPGTYKYVGEYELPENVSGKQPEVTMIVNVLKEKINKSELENTIKLAKKINNKTDPSKKDLSNIIKQADKVLKNKEASESEIDEAIKILEQKMSQSDKTENVSDIEKNKDETEHAELNNDKQLPNTATNIFNVLALGLFLIAIGFLFFRKRTIN